MPIIEAIVLGLVQGLTEFIPVSSSGHLLLLHEVFGSTDDSLMFDVALHVGTLLALLIYFRRDIWNLLLHVSDKSQDGKLARLLIMATMPAAVAGLLFGDFIDDTVRSPVVVAVMLFVVGLAMLFVDKKSVGTQKPADITNRQGLSVGFAQALALIPGVSRSGITMVSGMVVGLTRTQAARFSFLLAIPTIGGSALGLFLKQDGALAVGGTELIVGVATSLVSGLVAITFLLRFIERVGFKPFAVYRMVLALIVLAFLV